MLTIEKAAKQRSKKARRIAAGDNSSCFLPVTAHAADSGWLCSVRLSEEKAAQEVNGKNDDTPAQDNTSLHCKV